MTKQTATAFFGTQLAAADQTAPKEIMLFPAGSQIVARDGRKWTLNNAQLILDAFAANKGPLAIDYEHAQAHKAPTGELAPAAGWITALDYREGEGLFAAVEWTEKAAEMIKTKEYRFISPEFYTDKKKNVIEIAGAGLVNRPAIPMPALAREQKTEKENLMDLKVIAKALGLSEDADEAAVLAAIDAQKEQTSAVLAALKVEKLADAPAAITALEEDRTQVLASKDDKEKELAALRGEVDTLSEKDRNREMASVLDAAAAEGKITPASRKQFEAMCASEGGIERFKELAATLPVIIAPSPLKDAVVPTVSDQSNENPKELAAKIVHYKDEQSKLGRHISSAEALAELEEKQS